MTVAMNTLGVYLYPTGDVSAQFKHVLGKAFDWIARAKESNLESREAVGFYSHTNCGLD